MASQLELIAIQQRAALIPKNYYNDEAPANNYNPTHSRAIADSETPEAGRGTGANDPLTASLDYNGGTETDKFGNPAIPGTGRQPAFSMNQYNPDRVYTAPDTSANIGQVVIE